jgi:hypothetical protein
MRTKVGLLIDFSWAYPETVRRPIEDSLRLAFDDALADGIMDTPIQLVSRVVSGLPKGDADVVLTAWKELDDEGCVAILGPISSENALAVRAYTGPPRLFTGCNLAPEVNDRACEATSSPFAAPRGPRQTGGSGVVWTLRPSGGGRNTGGRHERSDDCGVW